MADQETPGAPAPDEGQRAPIVAQAAEGMHGTTPPPSPGVPATKLAFERWAVEKLGIVFNDRGRASGIKGGKAVKSGIRNAALINATRAHHRIPIGKTMTEAEFNEAISATRALEVR